MEHKNKGAKETLKNKQTKRKNKHIYKTDG